MGTLAGHLLPGSFFLAFSLWWTWSILHRYFICKKEALKRSSSSYKKNRVSSKYKNSASFLCSYSCGRRVHLEAVFKVLFTSVGIIGELATAFRDGKFVNLGNGQHITMYFFFLLNGIFDILQHQGLILIPDMDYVTAFLGIFIEAFLFYNHLGGRSTMDVQLHMFLVYALVAILVFGICEMQYRSSVLPALCRTFCFILQGTWFCQVGFLLYPPNGVTMDQESHSSMMITTMIFTTHCAVIFVFMSIATVLIYCKVKHMDTTNIHDSVFSYVSMDSSSDKVLDFNDDDSDIEVNMVRVNSDTEEETL